MIHLLLAGMLLAQVEASAIAPLPRFEEQEPSPARLIATDIGCTEPRFRPQAEAFVEALRALGVEAQLTEDVRAPTVSFTLDEDRPVEGYAITPGEFGLAVRASSPIGAAHAAASLLQAVQIEGTEARWTSRAIVDEPDVPYRSFMVDMGRNPHSPETLRRVVDMLWFYKGNYLQLHLSDDQLFSWPSRAFPRLYSERAGWSWSDFVELERYAVARGVTIVPELDVPGHSTILRREYPEVFGETTTELATRPEAQAGVETLIEELLSVFASTPYMHIGGDEAYGVPQEIQRDFINRLNAFVKTRGRRTVVWEGPRLGVGENKVDTDVLHINWRTIDFPAQQMLDAGYEVVNASWDPLYIVDHYPRTMFTAVEVERCYDLDLQRFAHINHEIATFAEPHRTSSADGIVGFCMPWWEGREKNLLPLCLPRFAAAASATWNREGEDDFEGFRRRQERLLPRFARLSGSNLPIPTVATPKSQAGNLAFRGFVTASSGGSQPHFGPARLTNGITDRFDHFLGFPTQPAPLEIVIELAYPDTVGRITVHETAVGQSHEVYEVLVSANGEDYTAVGSSGPGTRGELDHVAHSFEPRRVSHIKILTQGCHGLTFPSFSRLTEVSAFRE